MVHLASVINDKDVQASITKGVEAPSFNPPGSTDSEELDASVYGSVYASRDLPRHEMPEAPMPKEIAYRMIKDDLTLDGTPTLKSVQRCCQLLLHTDSLLALPASLRHTWQAELTAALQVTLAYQICRKRRRKSSCPRLFPKTSSTTRNILVCPRTICVIGRDTNEDTGDQCRLTFKIDASP